MADFDYEIQNAAALAQEISYQVQDRDTARRAGGDSSELSARIRNDLHRLTRSLEQLELIIRDQEARGAGNPRVLAQRKEAVRKLQIEKTRLTDKERALPGSSDRDALLSSGAGKSYGRETELTRDLTTQDMVHRTHAEMKAQDAVLDDMSKSLDTLKTMGGIISDETKLHMKLLDDVEVEIDKGDNALKRETARVEHVTKESRTCWLYSAICLLLLVLIALVLVRWH